MAANETPQVPPMLDEASINSLVEMINLLAAAKDAMSDQMVTRMAHTASEGMNLLDHLTRNKGLMYLLQALERPEIQVYLIGLSDALSQMSREIASSPPAKGGILGILRLVSNPGTQEGLRSLSLLGQFWSDSMRELHRRGG
ncbi:MAG: hypothetical protein OEM31_03250 [Gammaproteobacteria bacterium]|nr:hypothetical protein [Gammaproteobacteria bacterium]